MAGDERVGSGMRLVARLRDSPHTQTASYIFVDAVVVWLSLIAAYAARFEGAVPRAWAAGIPLTGVAVTAVVIILFFVFRLYQVVWKYAGVEILVRLGAATASGAAVLVAANLGVSRLEGAQIAPVSVVLLTLVFTFMGAATIRSLGRLQVYMGSGARGDRARVLIVGAGDAGSLLLRDIENQPRLGYRVVGFIDDDAAKIGRSFRGVPVLDSIGALPRLIAERAVSEVFVAIPSASVSQRRRVLDLCNSAGVHTRVVPSTALDDGAVGVSQLRKVNIEDLLGRDPVAIDMAGISRTLSGRSVAVTGAAGSIGSELCRQIVLMRPRELHLLEVDETRLYELYLELRGMDADIPKMHICDVRNENKVARVLKEGDVDIVFHAAAYKHVPLMELAPDEAVATNAGGTLAVLQACVYAGVRDFVLISTDKAVKPSSVMGATKALAERLTLAYARKGLCVSAVRFGNVLGSRGSVVPLFEEQLRRGGPVRVTHADATRYFMTIPEAARLVLQAQALSSGGELFVLEMGEPIRILDLARKMVALSGAQVDIVIDGLRPGEKLHETLTHDDHELIPTGCEKVLRLNALPRIANDFEYRTVLLIERASSASCAKILAGLASLIPDYQSEVAGTRGVDAMPAPSPEPIGELAFPVPLPTPQPGPAPAPTPKRRRAPAAAVTSL